MKKLIYSTLFLCALMFSGCIKDDSTDADRPIANIELKQQLQDNYVVNRGETLNITAPEVSQSPEIKTDLRYKWEINGKVVSEEPNLKYVCNDYGKYTGRLTITNGDDIKYAYFKLNVQYAYTEGLILLSKYQNRAIISYYPINTEGRHFKMDALTSNANIQLGAEPLDMYVRNDEKHPEIYVSTAQPNALFRINSNLMFATDKIDLPGDRSVTYLADDGAKSTPPMALNMVLGNRYAQLTFKSNIITNGRQKTLAQDFPNDAAPARAIGYAYAPDGNLNEELYFNNTTSRMIVYYNTNDFVTFTGELFKGQFDGLELIGMSPVGSNGMDFAALLRNKENGKYIHAHFSAGYHNAWSPQKNIAPDVMYKGEITHLGAQDQISASTTAAKHNILYYAVGNKIYAYNVLSKGSFPTEASIVCGTKGTISDLYITPDESLLYIAVNDDSNDKAGSVYCYDLNTHTMSWHQDNITGHIVKIGYKRVS